MADIITNLHPDYDKNTNLYPNIKKENIPSKSISTDKLDDNVLSLIGSLKPSGTDTSTNILAFTSNKGIYVATDNGHWYYWNGSAYVDGGVYQATDIADGSIDKTKIADGSIDKTKINNYLVENILLDNKINGKIVINDQSVTTKVGIYMSIDSYDSSYQNYKCVKLEIANCDCIDFDLLQSTGVPAFFYKKIDGTSGQISLDSGKRHIDLSDVKEITINFFGPSFCADFIITKNNVCQKLKNEMMINKSNIVLRQGIFFDFNNYNSTYTQHECSYVYDCKNIKEIKFKSSGNPLPDLVWKDKNNNIYGSAINTTDYLSVDVSNAVQIAFNFFDKSNINYLIIFNGNDNDSLKSLNKYNHYNNKGLLFNNTKSALFVGDSITKGFTSGSTITPNGYPKLFSDNYSMTYYNEAVGGAEYCEDVDYQGTTIPKMLTQITNSTHKDVNYLFIAGGINDWQRQNDLTTFKNAVSDTIDYALNNYPNAHIILITPINTTISLSTTPKNISVQEYRNVITEVGISKNNNRITILQGNLFNFPDETNNSFYINTMFGDGLHPSELGYKTAYLYGLIDSLS